MKTRNEKLILIPEKKKEKKMTTRECKIFVGARGGKYYMKGDQKVYIQKDNKQIRSQETSKKREHVKFASMSRKSDVVSYEGLKVILEKRKHDLERITIYPDYIRKFPAPQIDIIKPHVWNGKEDENGEKIYVFNRNMKVPLCKRHLGKNSYEAIGTFPLPNQTASLFHGSGAKFKAPFLPNQEHNYFSPGIRMPLHWSLAKQSGSDNPKGYVYEYKLKKSKEPGIPDILFECDLSIENEREYSNDDTLNGAFQPQIESQLILRSKIVAEYLYLHNVYQTEQVFGKNYMYPITEDLHTYFNLQ